MELTKLKLLVLLLFSIVILEFSCKPLKYDPKLFLKSKFTSLIIEGDKFEYLRKNELGQTQLTSGNAIFEKNNYILNSYDSLVSEQLSFKSNELHKANLSSDSIQIIVNASLNNFEVPKNKFCDNLPYIISFNKPLTSDKELKYFESANFRVPRSDIFNVYIYPKATCGYTITKEYLFFILNIYKKDTNFIEIELPDLNANRFSYLNFVDCKLINLSGNKYELQTGNNEILLNEVNVLGGNMNSN